MRLVGDDEAAQPYDSIMSTFKRDGRDKSGNDVQALEQLCKAFLVRMQEAAAIMIAVARRVSGQGHARR